MKMRACLLQSFGTSTPARNKVMASHAAVKPLGSEGWM